MISIESLEDVKFSWRKSLALAVLCKLAYADEQSIRNVCTNQWDQERIRVTASKRNLCFITQSSEAVSIIFRGSLGANDWLEGSRLRLKETPYGSVYGRFHQAFHSMKSELATQLEQSLNGRTLSIAGHGIGGSLALIAAMEFERLQESAHLSVTTFGQPRTGDNEFSQAVEERLGSTYRRFVFGDDLVTRVLPKLEHSGSVVQLDSSGLNRGDDVEFAKAKIDDSEMDRLRQVIEGSKNAKTSSSRQGGRTAIEFVLPEMSDHRIENYVNGLRRLAQQEERRPAQAKATKVKHGESLIYDLDLEFVQSTKGLIASPSVLESTPSNEKPKFPVLLRVSRTWKPYPQLQIDSQFGNLITCMVNARQLEQLQDDPRVERIETSREGGMRECDVSMPFVKADVAHQPPLREKGEECLIGVIDTGIDVLHHAFRLESDLSKTRIIGIWDQTNPTGPSPFEVNDQLAQRYGTYYSANQIQQFVDGSAFVPDALRDPDQHGTHVSSIAAGRASGGFVGGVAPAAEILVVIPAMQTGPGRPHSIGYSKSHVDALFWLKAAAAVESKPIAINVSLGMNAGPHDGSSLLEANFDAATGNGRDRGMVIVKSAGNERGASGHACVQAATGAVREISWDSSAVWRFRDYIECWHGFEDDLEFALVDPRNNHSQTVSRQHRLASGDLGGNHYTMRLDPVHVDNGDTLLSIAVQGGTADIQTGTWTLRIVGRSVNSIDGRVDAWVERDSSRAVRFLTGDNDEMTLSVPGTAQHVLTVAACHAQTPLELTATSSLGLTRDGRPKPDICAPGHQIDAALANSLDPDATVADTGTSMAAPHVTGAMCLALSKRKKDDPVNQLNARQLRTHLIQSCNNFRHNDALGFGVLNVRDFLNLI